MALGVAARRPPPFVAYRALHHTGPHIIRVVVCRMALFCALKNHRCKKTLFFSYKNAFLTCFIL